MKWGIRKDRGTTSSSGKVPKQIRQDRKERLQKGRDIDRRLTLEYEKFLQSTADLNYDDLMKEVKVWDREHKKSLSKEERQFLAEYEDYVHKKGEAIVGSLLLTASVATGLIIVAKGARKG